MSGSSVPTTKPVTPVPSRAPISVPEPAATPPPPPPESEDDDPSLEIPKGRICRRKACGYQYTGGERGAEKCVFHPGAPIFHEGSKGYTCCKRRVLEFDEFMKIEGCKTKDRHLFVGSGNKNKGGNAGGEELLETVRYVPNTEKYQGDETNSNPYRHDYYQTGTTVTASFFLKKIDKDKASVEFAPTELSLDLPTTDTPLKRYKAVVPLFGSIDPAASSFRIVPTKLEVTLVKADGKGWANLRSDERRTGEIIQTGKAGRA